MAGDDQTANMALQKQIDALGVRMDKGFEKLESLMRSYEERVRGIENREAGCQPMITARVSAIESDVKEHEKQLEAMKEVIDGLKHSNTITTWIGGIAGSAVILWFVGQLLGLIGK